MKPVHKHTEEPGVDCACDACEDREMEDLGPMKVWWDRAVAQGREEGRREGRVEERGEIVEYLVEWANIMRGDESEGRAREVLAKLLDDAADDVRTGKHRGPNEPKKPNP